MDAAGRDEGIFDVDPAFSNDIHHPKEILGPMMMSLMICFYDVVRWAQLEGGGGYMNLVVRGLSSH